MTPRRHLQLLLGLTLAASACMVTPAAAQNVNAQTSKIIERAALKSAARSVESAAYTEFWRGAGVDRTMLAQALPQLPDTADEFNAVAKDLGIAPSDIGSDGWPTSTMPLRRAPPTPAFSGPFALIGEGVGR